MSKTLRFLAVLVLLIPIAAMAADPEAPPADQEYIYQGEATSILGRAVDDPTDKQIGRIIDVLVDDQGQPRAAVIDFGGFMGVGNRQIAVAWRALHFLPGEKTHKMRLDMTADQIKAIPDYKPRPRPVDPPVAVAVPPAAAGPAASGK